MSPPSRHKGFKENAFPGREKLVIVTYVIFDPEEVEKEKGRFYKYCTAEILFIKVESSGTKQIDDLLTV